MGGLSLDTEKDWLDRDRGGAVEGDLCVALMAGLGEGRTSARTSDICIDEDGDWSIVTPIS